MAFPLPLTSPLFTMSDDAAASLPSPASNPHSNATPSHSPSPSLDAPTSLLSRPSNNSRAIVPNNPHPSSITPKVAIATASSPISDYNPSPVGGGPTSASYVVPPRPKPGRKPATDEPASKRKAQNRESQRAFRARKAAKLNEMQAQVDYAESRHKQEMSERIAELNAKDIRINQLEALVGQLKETEKRTAHERDYWKERAADDQARCQIFEQQLKERGDMPTTTRLSDKAPVFFQNAISESRQDSPTRESVSYAGYNTPKPMEIGCGNCKGNGDCACIAEVAGLAEADPFADAVPLSHAPPRTATSPMKGIHAHNSTADIFADREIDFTAQFSAKRSRVESRVDSRDPRPSIAFMTQSQEADSKCGFCTDDSNCLCRDESLRMQDIQRSDDLAHPAWNSTPDEIKPLVNNRAVSGPGSCADCQVNPRQRAWCQRVAQLKNSAATDYFSPRSSRNSSVSSPLDPIEPRVDDASDSRYSIGCSEAYKLFEGRMNMDQDKMDWVRNLKPVPSTPQGDTLPTSTQRKYSALEIDTAGVIATLQTSMAPLVPRKSDGENANLVRIAQEHQRSSNSPRVGQDRGDSPIPVSSLVHGSASSRHWR